MFFLFVLFTSFRAVCIYELMSVNCPACSIFSLKLECDKLATEKTEMQRHYVMYYEMSYGLNVEMHKQVSVFAK